LAKRKEVKKKKEFLALLPRIAQQENRCFAQVNGSQTFSTRVNCHVSYLVLVSPTSEKLQNSQMNNKMQQCLMNTIEKYAVVALKQKQKKLYQKNTTQF